MMISSSTSSPPSPLTPEEVAAAAWTDADRSWIFDIRQHQSTQFTLHKWNHSEEPGVIKQEMIEVFISKLPNGAEIRRARRSEYNWQSRVYQNVSNQFISSFAIYRC